MSLAKASILNAVSVTVKVGSALLLNKILAVSIGPTGYAVIGQLQNAQAVIVNFVGGIMAAGVTKSTAEHFSDEGRQHETWRTAMQLSLASSLVFASILFLAREQFAAWLFNRTDLGNVLTWLALALPAVAVNNMFLAIASGKKEIEVFVASNILSSAVTTLLVASMTYAAGLHGAMIAIAVSPAVAVIPTALMVRRRAWFRPRQLVGNISPRAFRTLAQFAVMGLVSALALPLTLMLIRDYLTVNFGFAQAGYWHAAWKISEMYLMLVTTTLSLYFLPRIAEIRIGAELRDEILKLYRVVLPIVVAGAVLIYLLREPMVEILFTSDFRPMLELYPFQLIGDVVKIASWILSYVLLGRGMVKPFIGTEIVFSMSLFGLCVLFTKYYGLQGVGIAYLVNFVLYWIAMAAFVKMEIGRMEG